MGARSTTQMGQRIVRSFPSLSVCSCVPDARICSVCVRGRAQSVEKVRAAEAPCVVLAEEAPQHLVLLAGAAAALAPRAAASFSAYNEAVGAWQTTARAEAGSAIAGLHARKAAAAKELEGVTEAEKVSGEQLAACAGALEAAAAGESWASGDDIITAAVALLARTKRAPPVSRSFLRACVPSPTALPPPPSLRPPVSLPHSSATGPGLSCYQHTTLSACDCSEPEGHNTFTVCVRDGAGEAVESVRPGDVSVCVHGGTVVSVREGGAGCVDVCYSVPAGHVDDVTVSVCVLGALLPASPWVAKVTILPGSVLLSRVSPAALSAFVTALLQWLPGKSAKLLYLGSRDGMNPRAYHDRCDRQGPLLTLIRSSNGYTFGGYAAVSLTDGHLGFLTCTDAFLFCVEGPWGNAFKCPLRPDAACAAVGYGVNDGPLFGAGVDVAVKSDYMGNEFGQSTINLGLGYVDVIGRANKTFTGSGVFVPEDIEVYAIS